MTLYRGDPVDLDPSGNGATPKGRRLGQTAGLLGKTTGGVVRTGVLVDGMAPVVSGSGSDMSYNVRACAIVTKHSDANGPTISALDATQNVAVADDGSSLAAPGSNSRIDVIYAVQDLIATDGGATPASNAFRLAVRKGTAAASPAIPSIADVPGAVALARTTVAAGTTTTSGLTYTRMHDWCTANGGIIPDSDGSRVGRAWDGERMAAVPLGLSIAGASATNCSMAYMQHGRVTATSNGAGQHTFPLPNAYATAIVGVSLTNVGAVASVSYSWVSSTAATVTVQAWASTGAPLPGYGLDFTYIAWGY